MEEFSLYRGEVILRYDDVKHKYVAIDDKQIINAPSITTVLKVINKPALVPWAVNQAINHLKSRLFDGGEFEPEEIDHFLDEAKHAHQQVKQEAADIGTEAHHWLETYWRQKQNAAVLGTEFIEPLRPNHLLVANCVNAATKWIDEHHIQPLIIEKPVYSRQHQVAGRLDKLAIVDGRLAVVDWKSSTGIWAEYVLQTAAYAAIYMEEFPEQKVLDRWLVKLGKYDGEFEAKCFGPADLDKDYAAFVAALTLQRRLKEIDKKL
jgi:hypothetical protein